MNDTDNLKAKRNLTALVEFSRIINSSLDLEFILNNVLLTCLGKFLATRGLMAIKVKDELKLKASKGLSADLIKKFPKLVAGTDFSQDPNFNKFLEEGNLHAYQKISSSEECIGIICLGEKLNKSPFTEDDIEFLKQF